VIITRLVDTMGNNPRPTRAEATDVANAVMDGADAFMLGAETLRGPCARDTISPASLACAERCSLVRMCCQGEQTRPTSSGTRSC